MLSIVDALVRGAQTWLEVSRPDTFCASSEKDLRLLTANAFSYKMIKGRKPRLDDFISNQYFTYFSSFAKVNLPGKFFATTFTHLRIS